MRRISRRELLGLGAAAGVIAATPGAAAGAGPERGGSLRLGLAGRGIGDFDGRRPFDPIMRVLGHGAAFDCLTEISADGALTGELATDWSASGDARVWTVRLRRGVRFHDGKPFGADDVIATFRWHRERAARAAAPVIGEIEHLRRLSGDAVQITLLAGDPGLPFRLADPQLIILPAGRIDRAVRDGVGTGLYRVEPGRTRDRVVLHRVPEHYRDGRAGWFERIEVLAMPDPEARLAALMSGRVDAINMVDAAWLPRIGRGSRFEIVETVGNQHFELSFDGGRVGEIRALRDALSLTIDRGAIVAAVLGGRGEIGFDDPLGPASPGRARRADVPPFDPARARELLSSAGLEGTEIGIAVPAMRVPGSSALGRELVAAARRAGLVPGVRGPVTVTARTRPGRPLEDWALALARPDPGDPSPAHAALLAEVRSTLDGARRRDLIATLQREIGAHGSLLVPAFAHGLIAHSARLGHPAQVGHLWDMDSARIAERWWAI